ncbi:hypothetical protein [Dyella sp. 2RAB6]|uniref:hypothetical protein n=1 Tax=Dyella sp. 2RAB6 TaxID=3232992 RepID=UPI003F8E969F
MTAHRYAARIHHVLATALAALLWSSAGMATSPADEPENKPWTPTAALVAEVEPQLRMPRDTVLGNYARYYYGEYSDGHRLLFGTFVRKGIRGQVAGVKIVATSKDVPGIHDGSCAQINVVYDADMKQVLLIRCNGMA